MVVANIIICIFICTNIFCSLCTIQCCFYLIKIISVRIFNCWCTVFGNINIRLTVCNKFTVTTDCSSGNSSKICRYTCYCQLRIRLGIYCICTYSALNIKQIGKWICFCWFYSRLWIVWIWIFYRNGITHHWS